MNQSLAKTAVALTAVAGFAAVGLGQVVEHPHPEATKPTAKERFIRLMEDRDQDYMVTKVYEIKNMKAVELRPFVEGAVRRANGESSVARLNYKFGKEQFLQVSMPVWMVRYIDDMVAKLDRPGIKDDSGSPIAGTGIHRFYYQPNFRSTQNLFDVIDNRYGGSDDVQHRDASSNLLYWKGSASDGKDVGKWIKALDRPVPQMNVSVNVYEINENNLKELGIDYIQWKNGPGAQIFGAGLESLNFHHFSDLLSTYQGNFLDPSAALSHMYGGFFVAPNIDATFLRLLNQKGKSRITTSPSLTIANTGNGSTDSFGNTADSAGFAGARYRISFDPNFQAITKDGNQEITVGVRQPTLQLHFINPVINFNDAKEPTHAAQLNFAYLLNVDNMLAEQANDGDRVENDYQFESRMTVAAGSEKLMAVYTKEHKVNQDNGVMGLGELPLLKYVLGSTSESKTFTRYFVTVMAAPVSPETSLSPWAGKIVTADDMLKQRTDEVEFKQLPPKNEVIHTPLTSQFNY